MPDLTPRETWDLDTEHVGRRVLVYDALPSTNDLAASLASDAANEGTVVLADFQSAGRGQYGRVWQSRPGSSLLTSVLVYPPVAVRRPVVMTAWVAVAVAETVFALTGVQARIKWPNDVLVRGKKVCGILIEQGAGLVAGIGLNLNQSADDFAVAGLPDATSLALVAGTIFDSKAAAVDLIRRLDAEYDRLLAGEVVPLEAEWKWRVGLLGRHVVAELTDGTSVTGRLRDLTFAGAELEVGAGVRAVPPEHVRQLRPA
jgi:BirA family biotin operon repressor/biotin-[acetyl-CoA-carboxylase] ligase